MARTYFTLCKFDTDAKAWFDEFGSYSAAEVREEMQTEQDNGTRKKHLYMIKTDGTAAALIARVAELNKVGAL